MSGSPRKIGGGLQLAFVAMLPAENAATRVFCLDSVEFLRKRGIAARLYLPSGDSSYRNLFAAQGKLRRVRAGIYWFAIVAPRRCVQLPRLMAADVVLIQRSMFRAASWPFLEWILGFMRYLRGRPAIVLHLDDALNVAFPRVTALRAGVADAIITGTAATEAWAVSQGKRVFRIETGVDASRYQCPRDQRRGTCVIGWTGTKIEYVKLIEEQLSRVCHAYDAKVEIISAAPYASAVLGGDVTWRPWTRGEAHSLFRRFDIGVMPLPHDAYAAGKEAYKLKECMASGVPVVASAVGHNVSIVTHGVTGFLVSDEDEWYSYLALLVSSPCLREEMGRAAQRFAFEHLGERAFLEAFTTVLLEEVG